ncbi:hypothetical protein [Streptomyces sp. NPDC020983]|uniref:hypothetical protein n=1 Tax=Streptomyces sp. NPDC020983 TaxID=3365106 RepID=UPI003792A3B5
MTALADALFVTLVALLAAVPTGHLAADSRGWFPGGADDDEPEPAPQPEEGK